ncbi:MAG: hypothetical protein MO846_02515 [Candidatus Devosia symbiotica]|nr:hypothetical protein [Candidatus Devosia symbiotica]
MSDYGDYRILSDGGGWHLHLREQAGWPPSPEDNPFGIYDFNVNDVDAVAEKVRDRIIEKGAPLSQALGHL